QASLRRNSYSSQIFLINVFSGNTLTCHPETEYPIGDECCPLCPPGCRVKMDCTEFWSTSCVPCVNGTFMDVPTGRRQCFPCTSCGSGSGLKNSLCTTTSDTVCEPLEGFYSLRHKRCEPGQYIIHKALTDTECSDCSDGTFSNGTSTSCQPHTQCESLDLQLIKPGTVSTDAECGKDYDSTNVVAIVVPFLLICVSLTVIYFFWMKKKGCLFESTNISSLSVSCCFCV
uniref:TNFR-Cys domain-containing protein n=1 Tax=Scophthalmus maximus TaxID=52904 RepID=A0A8D3EF19_SCOMX